MKLYISGPMRGYRQFNFPEFNATENTLRRMGHDPINPARRDLERGFDPKGLCGFENLASLGFSLREALAEDARLICEEADGVCVLWGWNGSKGAVAEVALARALGLPVVQLASGMQLEEVK